MKITFFLIKFPIASESFVLNQIISFINMGYEVKIVTLYAGDFKQIHGLFSDYKLRDKTVVLYSKLPFKYLEFIKRIFRVCSSCLLDSVRNSLFSEYGNFKSRLFLSAVIATNRNRTFQSDYIIAHFGPAGVFAEHLREFGIFKGKLATIFHGIDLSSFEILESFRDEYQKLFHKGDVFLPISNMWAEKLISLDCPRNKIFVSRMGVNIENFKLRPFCEFSKPLHLISVARLAEKKGIDVAVKACLELEKAGIDFHYTIVGMGPLKKNIEKLIIDMGLEKKITMLGFRPQEEINTLLQGADVFLLPSITASDGDMEGIPVALMEAMAIGLPTVATFHSGIPELITNNISGLLADEKDHMMLANKIIELSRFDIPAIKSMILEARKTIENKFNQTSINKKLAILLEEGLENAPSSVDLP